MDKVGRFSMGGSARNSRTVLWLLLVAATTLVLAGCGRDGDAGANGSAEQGGEGNSAGLESGAAGLAGPASAERNAPQRAFVDELAGSLDEHFAALAEPADLSSRLEQRLKAAIDVAERRASAKNDRSRPERDLWYEGTLDNFYSARAYRPAFTRAAHLTPASQALFAALADVQRHGLTPADYHVDELTPLVEKSLALSQEMRAGLAPLSDDEKATLVSALAEAGHDLTTDAGRSAAVRQILLAEGGGAPVPRLVEAFEAYRASEEALAESAIEIEVALADGYLRYARDMRHGNVNAVTDDEAASFGKRPVAAQHHTTIILARLRAQLDRWAELDTDNAEAVTAHLEALWPAGEQYRRLLEARERYVQIVANGGWAEVNAKALRKGQNSATVAAVKKRLAAEGYYDGPLDDQYDEAFTQAVMAYQETHQLEVTGESDKPFWRSLNVPAQRRLEEIEVNLKRARSDAHRQESDYYIYINVPDFHAEVWRDGKRDMRFRIVTGNTQKSCDPKTRTWTYANATPLQHAKLEYLVLNPYWNVPPRIEKEEYVDKIAADPQWLAKNGFEYYTDANGYTVLRQLPGKNNALGKVKFIFPNMHSTFMHDTAQKQYFKYPVRAFSHGCMRVQDPMDLAEYLLSNDGKWAEAQPYLDNLSERQINLSRKLDVFIDYQTVRVDDENRVHFLADIYRFVRDELEPPSAASLRCEPEPQVTLAAARAKLSGPATDDVEPPDLPPAVLDDTTAAPVKSGGGGGSAGATPALPPSRAPAIPTVD